MTRVLILRGIPGSGKSVEAEQWKVLSPDAVIVSADKHMFADGQEFDYRRLEACRLQCQREYLAALKSRVSLVIVDNTNTKLSDMEPYVTMAEAEGYAVTVLQLHVDPKVAFERGTHKVPLEVLKHLGARMWSIVLPPTWDVWSRGTRWNPNLDRPQELNDGEALALLHDPAWR